jgi:hypothetical protein
MRILILLLCAVPAFGGDLSLRLKLTMDRILYGYSPRYDEAFVIADAIPRATRRFTNFSGDLSGRYIEALSIAASVGAESSALETAEPPPSPPDCA